MEGNREFTADTKVTGDIYVYPDTEPCVWITFDSQGGTGVRSISVEPGESYDLSKSETPTRLGYSFKGWSTTDDGKNIVKTLSLAETDVILYAVWEGIPATYTVVYWGENADDDGYSVLHTKALQAPTGSIISSSSYKELPQISNRPDDWKHFVLNSNKVENTVVAANNSSVLNVYFLRKQYTLTFTGEAGKKEKLCEYGSSRDDVGGTVYTCGHTRSWQHNDNCSTHTHTAACFKTTGGKIHSITAKYGAEISKEFNNSFFTEDYAGRAWVDTGSTYSHALQTLDRMPGNNVSFKLYSKSSNVWKTIYYYLEKVGADAPDSWPRNPGEDYELLKEVGTWFNYATYQEEYHEILGFTRFSKEASGFSNDSKNFTNNQLDLYYKRNQYNLKFNNYSEITQQVVDFDAPLAPYYFEPAKKPANVASNAVFQGWYSVPPEDISVNTPAFDFTANNMPAGDMMLYAYWAEPMLDVSIVISVEGQDTCFNSKVKPGQSIADSANYASALAFLKREGLVLMGWRYSDTRLPVNLYDKLYADVHIQAVLAGVTYGVTYAPGRGSGTAPVDSLRYNADATAKAKASTFTAPAGEQFTHWNDAYGNLYYPGQNVPIGASDVVLTANYAPKEGLVTITYHSNFEPDQTSLQQQYQNNSAVTVKGYGELGLPARQGYSFLGWSASPSATSASYQPGSSVRINNDGENQLYAVWALTDYKVSYALTADSAIKTANLPGEATARMGDTVSVAAGLTKTGYKFEGWFTQSGAAVTVTAGQSSFAMPAADVTLYGRFVKDDSQVKTLSYTVQHVVEGNPALGESNTYRGSVWVNDPDSIEIQKGSLARKSYTGYKYKSIIPAVSEGDRVEDGAVITITYERDDSQIKTLSYTVKHIVHVVGGSNIQMASATHTEKVWINAENLITVQPGTLAKNSYTGYMYTYSVPAAVAEGQKVTDGCVIELHYEKDASQTHALSYRIEYYLDGAWQAADGVQGSSASGWIGQELTLGVDNALIDTDKYVGYRYDAAKTGAIPDSFRLGVNAPAKQETIAIHYTKDENWTHQVSYQLRYWQGMPAVDASGMASTSWTHIAADDSALISSEPVWIGQAATVAVDASQINMIDKYVGFKYSHSAPAAIPASYTIDAKVESAAVPTNYIDIYYIKDESQKHSVSYQLSYYKDGALQESEAPAITEEWIGQESIVAVNAAGATDGRYTGYRIASYSVDGASYTLEDGKLAAIPADFRIGAGIATTAADAHAINIYYEKRDDLSYTVKFYYGVAVPFNYVERGDVLYENATFATPIEDLRFSTTLADGVAVPEGYQASGAVDTTNSIASIGAVSAENIIRVVLHKRTDLSYTVKYLEQGTDAVLRDELLVENQTFNTKVPGESVHKEIPGYKLVSISPDPLTVGADSKKNIITLYYVKRSDLSFTVHHVEKDNSTHVLHEPTGMQGKQTYGAVIESAKEALTIPGYDYHSADKASLTIGVNNAENTITLYYVPRADLKYAVEYLDKDTSEPIAAATEVENQIFGAQVQLSEIAKPEIPGYSYHSAEKEAITIGANNDANVIRLYYAKRTDLCYQVYYWEELDGQEPVLINLGGESNPKLVENQTLGHVVVLENEIRTIPGFEYQRMDEEALTVGAVEENNVLNLYYKRLNNLQLIVNHYESGDHAARLAEPQTFENLVYGATVKAADYQLNIPGYTYAGADETSIIISAEKNEICLYYSKRSDLSYTVNYLEKDSDVPVAPAKQVSGQTYKAVVTEKAIPVEGYNFVSPTEQELTIEADRANVVKFYYTRRSDLSYTVQYLEKGSLKPLADELLVENQTFGAEVKLSEIARPEIPGYSYHSADRDSLTIGAGANLLRLYYAEDEGVQINYIPADASKGGVSSAGEMLRPATGVASGSTAQPAEGYVFTNWTLNGEVVEGARAGFKPEKGQNEIWTERVYVANFTERTDLSYIVKFYTDSVAKANYVAGADMLYNQNVAFGMTLDQLRPVTSVTIDAAKCPSGYDAQGSMDVASSLKTIGVNEAANIINVVLSPKTGLSYTVYHYWIGADKGQPESYIYQQVFQDKTANQSLTIYALDLPGYTRVDEAASREVIICGDDAENVSTFYYYKNVELSANSAERIYDGAPERVSGYACALEAVLGGENVDAAFASVTAGASGTAVNTYAANFSEGALGTVDDSDRYIVTKAEPGALVIHARPLEIAINSLEADYDGQAHTVAISGSEFAAEAFDAANESGLVPGHSVQLDVDYEGQDSRSRVGSYAATARGDTRILLDGEDVSANYAVTILPGVLTIRGNAIAIAKEASAPADGAAFRLGETIEYTIAVTNISKEAINEITVTDPLASFATGSGYSVSGGAVAVPTLESGESVRISASRTVSSEDILGGERLVNTASAKVGKGSPISASATVQLEPVNAAITVVKTSSLEGEAALGERIEYTIAVTNAGNVPCTNVIVEELLPGAAVLVDEAEYQLSGGAAVIASLPVGESVAVKAEYTVQEKDILAGQVENTAQVTADQLPDPVTASHSDSTAAIQGKISKVKRTLGVWSVEADDYILKDSYAVGDAIVYEIVVRNEGNVSYTGLTVEDPLTGFRVENVTLAPGAVQDWQTSYTVASEDLKQGEVVNEAVVRGGATPTPHPENPREPLPEVTPAPGPDTRDGLVDIDVGLSVVKAVTNTAQSSEGYAVGEIITYDITVKNQGNMPYTGVQVWDSLSGAELLPGDGYSLEGNVAAIEGLAVGASITVKAQYAVTRDDVVRGFVTNTAAASAGAIVDAKGVEHIPAATSEPVTSGTVKLAAAMTITKAATNTPASKQFKLGDAIQYAITVTNTGNVAVENVTVVDDILAGLEIAASDAYSVSDDGHTATIPSLAAGSSATVRASYTVTEADILRGSVHNEATASAIIPNPDDANKPVAVPAVTGPEDCDAASVDPSLNLVKITANRGEGFAVGDEILYHITVQNAGNVAYRDVKVLEREGVEIVSGEGYRVKNGAAVIESLAVGASVTVQAKYAVTQADILRGSVKNTATASAAAITDANGNEFIPAATSNEVQDPTVALNKTLTLTKTSDMGESLPGVGDVITYTITVKNDGNVDYMNLAVEELLPGAAIQKGKGYSVSVAGLAEIASLPVGQSVDVKATYAVTRDDVIAGKVINSAAATAYLPDAADPEQPGEAIRQPVQREDNTAALDTTLSLTKAPVNAPKGGYKLGDAIEYAITVKNDGNVLYENVTVSETLANAAILEGEGYALVNGAAQIETLAAGASVEVRASYTVTEADIAAGKVVNTVTASANPVGEAIPNATASNETPTEAMRGALAKEKTVLGVQSADGSYSPKAKYDLGDVIWYQIRVTNTGNLTQTGIQVSDNLTGASWNIASLAPGQSNSGTTSYTVKSADLLAGKVENYASVTAGATPTPGPGVIPEATPVPNPNPTPDTSSALVDVNTTLRVEKAITSKAGGYEVGEEIAYDITVTNAGNVPYAGVTVRDLLPGAVLLENPAAYSLNADGSATIQSLGVNASVVVKAKYAVTRADVIAGAVSNSASAAALPVKEGLAAPSGESNVVTAGTAPLNTALSVSKAVTGAPAGGYGLGETIAYEITVTNAGNVSYENVQVVEQAGVNIVSGEGYAFEGSAATIETLEKGQTVTVKAEYVVTSADILAGKVLNSVTASADPVKEGAVPSGSAENIPAETAGISAAMTVRKETTSTTAAGYGVGETIEYAITVTNAGNVPYAAVTVTEQENVSIVADEAYASAGNTATIETLAAGESVTVKAQYTVTEADILAGEVKNKATASAAAIADPDPAKPAHTPGGSSNEVTDPAQHLNTALSVVKTTLGALEDGAYVQREYAVGDEIFYQIEVTNEGNVAYPGMTVTELLPGAAFRAGEGYALNQDGSIASLSQALPAGETATLTASYIVQRADVIAGAVENRVSAKGVAIPDPRPLEDRPNQIPEASGSASDDTVKPVAALALRKAAATGEALPGVGDSIAYTIEVENTGNISCLNVIVDDGLEGAAIQEGEGYGVQGNKAVISELKAGQIVTIGVLYTVDRDDVIAGRVVNTATAQAAAIPNADDPTRPFLPRAEAVATTHTEKLETTMAVVKTITSSPANGKTYALGETISYEITATNTGNVDYLNAVVLDELTGDRWEIGTLAAGARSEVLSASYQVQEADIVAGKVLNVATATADPVDDEQPAATTPSASAGVETPTDPIDPALDVVKTVTSSPADGAGYGVGETIAYSITVTNRGNLTYKNVAVRDPLTGGSWDISSLPVGESRSYTTRYSVTDADVVRGGVVNTVTAKADPVDPAKPDAVPVGGGQVRSETVPLNTALAVAKAVTSSPANGEAYVLGETITYSITVTNAGNVTYHNLRIRDDLTGDSWSLPSLAAGASQSFTASHAVTEADVAAGQVVNRAAARADALDPARPETTPQGSDGAASKTEPVNAALNVVKTTASSPANGAAYAEGETIAYSIVVTNAGNVNYTNVQLADLLTGDIWSIPSLPVGASESFTASYTVTQADLLRGSVVNTATASADPVAGITPSGSGQTSDPTVAAQAGLGLSKVLLNLPARGYFHAGEVAQFEIRVSNTGNVALTDIAVTEGLAGASLSDGSIPSLKPGESASLFASYAVKEGDLGQSIFNSVQATAQAPEGLANPSAEASAAIPTDQVVNISGVKTWDDRGNQFATRPGSISLRLLANGEQIDSKSVSGSGDSWAYSFGSRPMHDANGAAIAYSVREAAVEHYDTEYSGFNITNRLHRFTLTVRYWYGAIGGESAAPDYQRSAYYGEAYNVASPQIPGYAANPQRVTGVITGDTVRDVIYTADEDLTLTIYYVYRNGETAAETYQKAMAPGEGFAVESPRISGHSPSKRSVEGAIKGRSLVYTVIYASGSSYLAIDEYGAPLGVGNVETNLGDCFE